ncbi:hypothetical protein BaOVIS_022300 [Babesia ovis]|uniref:Uncharacterized protein n=1 Tax=Babesia ovis TaxID=5869 RepID=A0A9W5TBW1_BABOV|nr:hypothetical protein BaOVIS_022300 [Babesia ovis]
MCKSRRRVKGAAGGGSHPAGEILVDESETEITTDDMANESPANASMEMAQDGTPNSIDQYAAGGELSLPLISPELAPEIDAEDLNETQRMSVESLRAEDDDVLALYLKDVDTAAIEDRRSFSHDFAGLQDYCKNRLQELMSNDDIAIKCLREMVPSIVQNCLAVPTECQSCQPVVRGCLGLGEYNDEPTGENTEFRVIEDRGGNPDMPTLPTGMWFVDTINEAFDKWSDRDANMGNMFKLLNLSALLTYCGDSTGERIVDLLSRTSSIVSRGPEAWREIIRSFTTEESLETKPMPTVPNAKFVSRCEAKLDDVPDLDSIMGSEDAFRVYWFYTERWLRSRLNPSLSATQELSQQARDWFTSLESGAQEMFTRLSRTLCCQSI